MDAFEWMDSKGVKEFVNLSAGFGDALLLGSSKHIRNWMGISQAVDVCSTAYKAGEIQGEMVSLVIPGGAPLKGAKLIGNSGKIYNDVLKVGGRYSDIVKEFRGKLRANDLNINHMPSKAWNKQENWLRDPTADGGAIMMTRFDHYLTRTYGGKNVTLRKIESGLSPKEVIYRDIKDVRDLFGTKYDPVIMDMLRY